MSIESYRQLEVWKKSISLVKGIYGTTALFPGSEQYGLSGQMRRAAVSIPSNIAEGYGRRNRGEYLQFLGIAAGSAAELDTQIFISKELYPKIDFSGEEALLVEIQKMLFAMLRKLKDKDR